MLRYAWVLVLAGCLQEGAVTCGDGTLCPFDTRCARLAVLGESDPVCRDPDDFDACNGLIAGDSCTSADDTPGTCFEALEGLVCIGAVCGDRLQDRGEACDDGDLASGNGCSADCLSDETCGNAVLDGLKLEQCDDGNLVDHDGCDSRCKPERATWTKLEIDRMAPRTGAAMAFDARRGVAVLFGGATINTNLVFDETWLWNGIGWSRASPTTKPSARGGTRMVYDSARERVVMFGGASPDGTLGDTWEWDGANWARRAPAVSPKPREAMGMAYDSRRKRTVLFGGIRTDGGIVGAFPLDDTWEWDGTIWTRITPAVSPSARANMAMAYDPRRGKVVLFGGLVSPPGLAPALVWEYDGVTWSSIAATSPPSPRQESAMAWDARSQTVLMFGGQDGTGNNDQLWAWDGTRWTRDTSTPRPVARQQHAVASDPVRGTFFVIGGVDEPATTMPEWNGAAWSSGLLPDPVNLEFGQAALDPLRGRAVLVDHRRETWESDGRGWVQVQQQAPSGGAMTYDPERKRVVLFGGHDGSNYTGETMLWDGARWTVEPTPIQPSPRQYSAMAYDHSRRHAVLFGGLDAGFVNDETWLWDTSGWHQVSGPSPSARSTHAIGYDPLRREVVMFGGLAAQNRVLDDTWVWNGTGWEEHVVPITERPPGRSGASIAFDPARRRLVMFGGGDGGNATLQDVWEWEGSTWRQVITDASPAHRFAFAMFPLASGAGIAVLGGHGAGIANHSNDHWMLRWEGTATGQVCGDALGDQDLDGKLGCDDVDCWSVCTPLCSPGAPCDPAMPDCGDGMCGAPLETCRFCPGDCGPCAGVCGDTFCDAGETIATCPGDCTP